MSAISERPSDDVLRDMSKQPKMTFARMARELAVDRKTVRRWCRDAGIEKCGSDATENDKKTTENVSGMNNPIANAVLPCNGQTVPEIDILQRKMSWLIEWNTLFHDRLRVLEDALIGAACPVPYMMQSVMQGEILETKTDLFSSMLSVAYKIGAGEELTNEESDFFADFCMMTRAATVGEFLKIEGLLMNHWHNGLSVADSKAYIEEKRNGGLRKSY